MALPTHLGSEGGEGGAGTTAYQAWRVREVLRGLKGEGLRGRDPSGTDLSCLCVYTTYGVSPGSKTATTKTTESLTQSQEPGDCRVHNLQLFGRRSNMETAVRQRNAQAHWGDSNLPRRLLLSCSQPPKLDLTFLYLLNLIALVREGQLGGRGGISG